MLSLVNLIETINSGYFSLFLFSSFFLLGAGIKYVDDAFDEKIFFKSIALVVAPLLGILWGITMALNNITGTLLLAILLAVLFKGKIDNVAHITGFLVIIFLLFVFGFFSFLLIPLIFITIAGIIDEIGNDIADKKIVFSNNYFINIFFLKFFEFRFTMKLAVLAFALMNFFSLIYFVAFILFDLGYHLMAFRGMQLIKLRRFTFIPKKII